MDDNAEDLAVHWLDEESEIVEGLFLGEDLAGHANLFHSRIIGILQDNASVPVAAPEASVPDELPQVIYHPGAQRRPDPGNLLASISAEDSSATLVPTLLAGGVHLSIKNNDPAVRTPDSGVRF
ncbi:hypothetical protein CYLTODRAFT_412994 [Cylindrobasidium torrendii FP15055 ss-10]|uniref:Uncharacterized protein n=1 Tax=Cylindrobasidium torrendii FP15055 ss-10 TaxID=1314674 RepID=A0A0D7B5V3_9AGAR|nr:hypothetical protein CYLTODRAFT_412994 [Cylindrobasidium torrendii FP15055 ss-10]